jgi:hypothetical protein
LVRQQRQQGQHQQVAAGVAAHSPPLADQGFQDPQLQLNLGEPLQPPEPSMRPPIGLNLQDLQLPMDLGQPLQPMEPSMRLTVGLNLQDPHLQVNQGHGLHGHVDLQSIVDEQQEVAHVSMRAPDTMATSDVTARQGNVPGPSLVNQVIPQQQQQQADGVGMGGGGGGVESAAAAGNLAGGGVAAVRSETSDWVNGELGCDGTTWGRMLFDGVILQDVPADYVACGIPMMLHYVS